MKNILWFSSGECNKGESDLKPQTLLKIRLLYSLMPILLMIILCTFAYDCTLYLCILLSWDLLRLWLCVLSG